MKVEINKELVKVIEKLAKDTNSSFEEKVNDLLKKKLQAAALIPIQEPETKKKKEE
jgi:mRNA-degrading endonuclease RelE of RelBE toxin-antitoxin system